MDKIIEKAKKNFLKMVEDFGSDPYHLRSHVPEVERWANYLLKSHPEADPEAVLLFVWMHDLGHYPVPTKIAHAIRGEKRAKEFLEKLNYPKNKMEKVLHCIRAHRCRDIQPNSIEAKIIACVDSASHITDVVYFNIAKSDKENNCKFRVYGKIERDFRDLSAFPEIQNMLKEILVCWKKLIKLYEEIDLN